MTRLNNKVVEDVAMLQKDKEEREKEVKIQRDILESLKGKVNALEGSKDINKIVYNFS